MRRVLADAGTHFSPSASVRVVPMATVHSSTVPMWRLTPLRVTVTEKPTRL